MAGGVTSALIVALAVALSLVGAEQLLLSTVLYIAGQLEQHWILSSYMFVGSLSMRSVLHCSFCRWLFQPGTTRRWINECSTVDASNSELATTAVEVARTVAEERD